MTEPTPAPPPRRARLASAAIGGVIALGAGVFVVRTLVRDRRAIGDALADASPAWMALALVLAIVGMTAIAVPWSRALRVFGAEVPMGQVTARYFLGEIGKYLPGGVWPILGRGELITRWGVPRPAAYGSVGLSLITLYLGAMATVIVGLPSLQGGQDSSGPVAVVVLLPVGVLALHPAVLVRMKALIERILRRPIAVVVPAWRTSLTLVLCYVPAWLAIGTATWAVARALDPQAPFLELGTAAVLSWVVGFVLVPVPGGVGVREAAFVAAAGSLDPGIAAAVALAARAIFVLVDAVGAVIGAVALRRSAVDG